MSELIPNCCVNCYWFDGFTGECSVGVDQDDVDIYQTPCPNPIYFQAGQGHCIDQHDLWRDGDFHKQRLEAFNKWKKEAKLHQVKVRDLIKNYSKWYLNKEEPK